MGVYVPGLGSSSYWARISPMWSWRVPYSNNRLQSKVVYITERLEYRDYKITLWWASWSQCNCYKPESLLLKSPKTFKKCNFPSQSEKKNSLLFHSPKTVWYIMINESFSPPCPFTLLLSIPKQNWAVYNLASYLGVAIFSSLFDGNTVDKKWSTSISLEESWKIFTVNLKSPHLNDLFSDVYWIIGLIYS